EASFGAYGPAVKWLFLLGAWSTVFSSLFGVWQSVPYLFADLWRLLPRSGPRNEPVNVTGRAYRGYLLALATVPAVCLVGSNFRVMQQTYAVVGAIFVPM